MKYLNNKTLFTYKKRNDSQFWRGIQAVKHKIRFGVTFKVRNGGDTMFWDDIWLADIPLRLEFPALYDKCGRKKNARVKEFWDGEEWTIPFCRPLGACDIPVWEALMDRLDSVHLFAATDTPVWELEKSGKYSTKSMYQFLSHRGVINKRLKKLWACRLPMKLKVFLWLAVHGRLQTGAALKQKKWKGSANCHICGEVESVDHIFFRCVVAHFVYENE